MSGKTIDLEVIGTGNNKYTVKMDKPVCSEINFLCIKIIIAIFVISILVETSIVVTLCLLKSMDFKYIVFAAIFMVTAVTISLLTFEVSKSFAKIAFLKSIMESGADNNDLIKKYCDTLAEL